MEEAHLSDRIRLGTGTADRKERGHNQKPAARCERKLTFTPRPRWRPEHRRQNRMP